MEESTSFGEDDPKNEGKTLVYQFEEGKVNDRLKQKLEKKGVTVREGIPMEELDQ